jgi:hypothetical protein
VNSAHLRQSRPDSGLGFQVKVLQPFEVVLFLPDEPRLLILTPMSIKNNTFLKLILIEHTPLLTCFEF